MRMRMRVRVKEKEREMPFCGKTAGFISKMAEEVVATGTRDLRLELFLWLPPNFKRPVSLNRRFSEGMMTHSGRGVA